MIAASTLQKKLTNEGLPPRCFRSGECLHSFEFLPCASEKLILECMRSKVCLQTQQLFELDSKSPMSTHSRHVLHPYPQFIQPCKIKNIQLSSLNPTVTDVESMDNLAIGVAKSTDFKFRNRLTAIASVLVADEAKRKSHWHCDKTPLPCTGG